MRRLYRTISLYPALCLFCLLFLNACGTAPQTPADTATPSTTPATKLQSSPTVMALQTDCPTQGTGRTAIISSISPGTHQNAIYTFNQGLIDAPISATLKRYDLATQQKTDILNVPNGYITEAQLSADGQWILFVERLSTHQDAIQLIRIDGQQLQTLYCAPIFEGNNPNIIDLHWSPDNKQTIFDEGHDMSASLVKHLSLADGTVYVALTSPAGQPEGALPQTWLDNTHIYMRGFVPNSGAPNKDIFLLDLSKGENQQINTVQKIESLDGPCYDFDLSYDRGKLFVSTCAGTPGMGQPSLSGPSDIVSLSTTGDNSTPVYKDTNNAISAFRVISATQALISIENTTGGDPVSNAVYKLPLNGGALVRLVPLGTSLATFNANSQEAWSNVSRDSSQYAVIITDSSSINLYIGALTSPAPTKIATFSGNGNIVFAGWTTA